MSFFSTSASHGEGFVTRGILTEIISGKVTACGSTDVLGSCQAFCEDVNSKYSGEKVPLRLSYLLLMHLGNEWLAFAYQLLADFIFLHLLFAFPLEAANRHTSVPLSFQRDMLAHHFVFAKCVLLFPVHTAFQVLASLPIIFFAQCW